MTSEPLQIVSVREQPEELECFIACFNRWWGSEATLPVYRDCMTSCLESPSPLPQWYLLRDDVGAVLGGVGLVTNDFISRMDLWPWLCALYVEEGRRGQDLGRMLIEHVKVETARLGFGEVYLCTDHIGYYERFGFRYLGQGYHPWGEASRIYAASLPA